MSDLTYIYRVTRRARTGDPGAIEEGAFRVDGNTVILYDAQGKTILGKDEIVAPFNAAETAKKLLKRRPAAHSQSFSRPLRYPKLAY